ncbi:hypothetical protein NP233_g10198 [Leucocoprinus birnbaumii]|uniref:Potassium channel domain-containing protein n=1 Tax=Leucocoprinus birnbaumii TaxID=56174 RepID=A0AAD5YQ39_9AGAR|nr:hypothetical protein NP233_g10198 [Leucocoprinus birnbaumii]
MPLSSLLLAFSMLNPLRVRQNDGMDSEKGATEAEYAGRSNTTVEITPTSVDGSHRPQSESATWQHRFRDLSCTLRARIFSENQTLDIQSTGFRVLPLISSVFVPFAILLAIPGLVDHWYIRTNVNHQVIEYEENPMYLRTMLALSMACAVITNICLLIRLLEKMVKKMTFVCIAALSIHDILDTIVIVLFIVKTQTDDGFSLGQAFWMTLCSTLASLVTNITLILDYWGSSDSERHRSGLTEKQRSLTIIVIVLLCYVAFGAAVHTSLLSLSFIDALYFTVVCIETVGFGDIDPQTPGARIFSSVFTAMGIVILAVAIGQIREALLESIQANLYSRIRRARRQRIMKRWMRAVEWRLGNARLPVWVPVHGPDDDLEWPREMELWNGKWRRFWWRLSNKVRRVGSSVSRNNSENNGTTQTPMRCSKHMRLNVMALSEAQLRAAAMEAGAPLQELLPRHSDEEYASYGGSETVSPTHHRIGHMASVLRNFAYAVSIGQTPSSAADSTEEGSPVSPLSAGTQSRLSGREDSTDGLTQVELENEEKRMCVIRITFAFTLFLGFWLVGSAIFMATEKWSFWLALYFCFLTFSTVGYGDPVPKTPAGRSVFVGWALFGIATMTILISLLADLYSERYKTMISSAEARLRDDDRHGNDNLSSNMSPLPSSTSRVTFGDRKSTDYEKRLNIGRGGSLDVFENEEVASRLDSLKALVVDETAHKEGKLLHTLDTELQSMLLLIRRARRQPSRGE